MLIDGACPSPRVYIFPTASALLWCLLPSPGFWTLLLICFLPMLSHLPVLAAPHPPPHWIDNHPPHEMSMLDQSTGLGGVQGSISQHKSPSLAGLLTSKGPSLLYCPPGSPAIPEETARNNILTGSARQPQVWISTMSTHPEDRGKREGHFLLTCQTFSRLVYACCTLINFDAWVS